MTHDELILLFSGIVTAFYGIHSAILVNQGNAIARLNEKMDKLMFFIMSKKD